MKKAARAVLIFITIIFLVNPLSSDARGGYGGWWAPWAVSQVHYDPTQPTGGMPEAQLNQMRADYQRAMGACLDGRGYTMR
ncbi:MAG: hypothetical protein NTV58_13410 [Deltaproteobacteria bacterium]|nr:hypothetical protein [Deltaproteobacteria bacterium]